MADCGNVANIWRNWALKFSTLTRNGVSKLRMFCGEMDSYSWFPVGRLDADVAGNLYRFRYVQGAIDAAEQCGFAPFDSFPNFEREYVSGELFPFFANRLQNASRPSFREHLRRLNLERADSEAFDPIEVLAVSEGRRATDNLEIFPNVERSEDGSFAIKFFLHGWRHIHPDSANRILSLQTGETLGVAIEATNPATGFAIQIQTQDRVVIGYAPRYLIDDLAQVILQCAGTVSASVSRLNRPPAPPSQRLLVSFEGCWPDDYQPMSGEMFETLIGVGAGPEWNAAR